MARLQRRLVDPSRQMAGEARHRAMRRHKQAPLPLLWFSAQSQSPTTSTPGAPCVLVWTAATSVS